jgi:ABC-type branched-subunit amino acid transport system substrate-binding protein
VVKQREKNPIVRNVLLRVVLVILIAVLLIGQEVSGCGRGETGPLKVGVLLDLTGPNSLDSKEVLNWITDGVNGGGGIGGKEIQLVYHDTYQQDITALATELVNDPAINIVIGPLTSDDLFEIAPLFIEKQKLLISPTATSGNIMRAFAEKDYIWRTCQSDAAQVRSVFNELAARQVKSVSLVYTLDSYGETFYEWVGFFCTELGINLTSVTGFDASSNFTEIVAGATAGGPDYVLAAAYAREAAQIKQALDAQGSNSKLFLTDAAETGYLIENLGASAEGLELISPAADPESGFEAAYNTKFGFYPYDYAASTCDALLLSLYTLARQEAAKRPHDEGIEISLKEVLSGSGTVYRWDQYNEAIKSILAGGNPDIEGASGPLKYDKENGVDPTESFYSLNRVETRDGVTDFRTISRFSSTQSNGIGRLDEYTSAVLTRTSQQNVTLEKSITYLPGKRSDLWAVIAVTSDGWPNYRHQSDALAVYRILKDNGVTDDHILLLSADDVPWVAENPEKGDIHHELKGENLRNNAEIDYAGTRVTPETLRNVMLGKSSPETPDVLGSNEESNVLVYIVGHGSPGAIDFANGEKLTAAEFTSLAEEMYSLKKYRQMLIMDETCFGESMALGIDNPGLVFFTGASRMESSFGATYDFDIKQWLADDFTARALEYIIEPGMTIEQLYIQTYNHVTGSHVKLVNYQNFGDVTTPVSEFFKP